MTVSAVVLTRLAIALPSVLMTQICCEAPAAVAASQTQEMRALPATSCRGLASFDFRRVPLPAARISAENSMVCLYNCPNCLAR